MTLPKSVPNKIGNVFVPIGVVGPLWSPRVRGRSAGVAKEGGVAGGPCIEAERTWKMHWKGLRSSQV